jgi:hypothetical protein
MVPGSQYQVALGGGSGQPHGRRDGLRTSLEKPDLLTSASL